jgi:hypothetical protein
VLRRIPPAIFATTLLSLLVAVILAFDWMPFLRGGFGWQWPFEPVGLGRAVPLVVAAIVYLIGSWLLLKNQRRIALLLVWGALGAAVIPLTILALRSDNVVYELFVRTASGVTTGPHLAAAEIDWNSGAWHDWPAVMDSYEGRSVHVRLSPPGLPMWYGLLNAFFERFPQIADALYRVLLPSQCQNWNLLAYSPAEWASAWFGMLMPLWAAFAVFPLYAVAHRMIGTQAPFSVLWWPLIPVLVMFVPSWNTLYPLFALLAFWLLLKGLENRKGWAWFVGAGVITGLLTISNFSLVPFISFIGIYTLFYLVETHRGNKHPFNWRSLIEVGLCFGIGLAAPWVIYGLITGLTPFDLLRTAMNTHLSLDRPYLPWLWLHFWEWALLTGVPVIVLWLLRTRQWRERGSVLSVSLLVTIFLLLLSGTARGETGRVWLFFAPFVLISAAGELDGLTKIKERLADSWLVIGIGQATLMIVLAITWAVINAPDMMPPPAPPGGLGTTNPTNAAFDTSFRLVGWDASADENAIILRLDWQSTAQITTPYWFSALLVAPDGTPQSESTVWQPLETHYPTTCWADDETVGDTIRLLLPPNAASGDWWISLSAFADVNNPEQRLTVTLSDSTVDNQVGLGPVSVR